MASIADRWHVTDPQTKARVRTRRYGKGKRWQVRYRDPDGMSRNRSFERKADAERFLVELQHRLSIGSYVDARAGAMRFETYVGEWLDRQILEPTSREAFETRLKVHVLPEWGDWPLARITSQAIQRWVRNLSDELKPSYVRLLVVNLGAILAGAVEDGLLPTNPARSAAVRTPKVIPRRIVPWRIDQVLAVLGHVPLQHRGVVAVAAGCGLRQGEAFGLRIQDIDLHRDELLVRQQIRLEGGQPVAALPKYRRTRSVPLPLWVREELVASLERRPALPGERLEQPCLGGLLFYSREKRPLNRNYFNKTVWKPALESAGIANERDNGMHALRHTCASLWLEHGVSIKAVSEYLGHADPGFTLRVYTHVMPTSGERARQALDGTLGQGRRPAERPASPGAHSAHERALKGGH